MQTMTPMNRPDLGNQQRELVVDANEMIYLRTQTGARRFQEAPGATPRVVATHQYRRVASVTPGPKGVEVTLVPRVRESKKQRLSKRWNARAAFATSAVEAIMP